MNGHYSPQVYAGQPMVGPNTLMPMYPLYHYHHQSHTMGLPAHIYSPTTAGHVATVPTIMSKPASIAPNTGRYIHIPLVLWCTCSHAITCSTQSMSQNGKMERKIYNWNSSWHVRLWLSWANCQLSFCRTHVTFEPCIWIIACLSLT